MNITNRDEMKKIVPFHGEKVMIVDDNELNLEVMKKILGRYGLSPEIVVNGKEALRRYLMAEEFSYRIILMDLDMYGMDGYETTKKIRTSERRDSGRIPIFAFTADVITAVRRKASECGIDGYIDKPVNYTMLLQMFHETFRRQENELEELESGN